MFAILFLSRCNIAEHYSTFKCLVFDSLRLEFDSET